eukprot:14845183-Heterocapsa_arctica.AAC.1
MDGLPAPRRPTQTFASCGPPGGPRLHPCRRAQGGGTLPWPIRRCPVVLPMFTAWGSPRSHRWERCGVISL